MSARSSITTLEIKDVLSIIRRRKVLIILPILLVTLIAFGGSYLLEKRFQSSTLVVTDQTTYLSKQLQAMVPGQEDRRFSNIQMKSRLIAIHNEIVSTNYLTRLIDELDLADDPKLVRQAQKLHQKRPEIPIENLIYHLLIQRLRDNIKVDFNGEDIIQITAESSDPVRAMNIATKLAEIFKDERLKRELSGVRGALDFSDEQLAIYKKNLEEAERRKADFMGRYIQNQLDESVTADKNIRTIMADIDNIKLHIEDNVNEQKRVRSELSDYSKSDLDIDLGDRYDEMKQDIYEETERLTSLMSKYTWSDPKVLNANLKINNLLSEMEDVIEDRVEDAFPRASFDDREALKRLYILQARETVNRQKLNDFEVALATLRSRISQQPQIEIQLRNLENDVASAREIYEKFKDQLTGSEISQSLMRGCGVACRITRQFVPQSRGRRGISRNVGAGDDSQYFVNTRQNESEIIRVGTWKVIA